MTIEELSIALVVQPDRRKLNQFGATDRTGLPEPSQNLDEII